MRLDMRTWGSGSRTAALVHGYTDDSTTWWWIGPALAERGYTVLAPDLRGHGRSSWAPSYAVADFAADLRDTLPQGADLVLGHSLGGLALAAAVGDLDPVVAVYVDPPWLREPRDLAFTSPQVDVAQVRAAAPRWTEQDIAVDVASTALMDPAVSPALLAELTLGALPVPLQGTAHGHVVVPTDQALLPAAAQELLASRGYVVHRVQAGHVVHRDDPQALLAVLDTVQSLVAA